MNNKPKRRKSNDNPYTLEVINNTNVVIFKDSKNELQVVKVSGEVYNLMNQFELDDISQMHKIHKHIDKYTYFDEIIYSKAINKPISIEQQVEHKILIDKIKKEINTLPIIQRERIKKYFFENKTYDEIAKEEGINKTSVMRAINSSIEKISKKIKN